MTFGKRLCLGLIVGVLLVVAIQVAMNQGIPLPLPGPEPGPLTIVGVYESRDLRKYGKEQLEWLRGQPFADKMKTAGHSYYAVDQNIVDKDKQPPKDLVPFLDAAKPYEKKLPVLTMRKVGRADVKVAEPKTMAEAERAVKDGGG